jgi:hypothetical protein
VDRILRCSDGTNLFSFQSTTSGNGVIWIYVGNTSNYMNFVSARIFTAGEFTTISIVVDLSQETNANRVKLYKNGQYVLYDGLSGTFPSSMPDFGDNRLIIGDASSSLDGAIGEFDFISGIAETEEQVNLHYLQWTNTAFYSAHILPVIKSVTLLSSNQARIEGTGFLPELTVPTGTINGIPFVIEGPPSDTILNVFINGVIEGKVIVTNSDMETAIYTMSTDMLLLNVDTVNEGIINISSFIDEGRSLYFQDYLDQPVNISEIQLDTAGYINFYGKGYSPSDSKRIYLSAGKWHDIGGINCILAEGTDKNIGIHAKI